MRKKLPKFFSGEELPLTTVISAVKGGSNRDGCHQKEDKADLERGLHGFT